MCTKTTKIKKVGGDFADVMSGIKSAASTVGDVLKTAATVAPYVLPLVGLCKETKPSEWNELVRKVRAEKGLSSKDTSKLKTHQRE